MKDFRKEAEQRLKGYTNLTGIVVESAVQGHVVTAFDVRDELKNPQGMVHGGATFTLMDTAAGMSGIYKESGNRRLVSQCASVHYLRPICSGHVRAEARLVKDGRNTALSRVDVYDESGSLAATGDFELFYIE